MKKIISLIIGCSLALAGAALAQQPVEQQSPSKGKRAPEKTHATEAQPRTNAAGSQERPANQTGETKHRSATNEHGATNEPGSQNGRTTRPGREAPNAETNASRHATEATNEPHPGKNRKERAGEESANTEKTRKNEQAEQQRNQQTEQSTERKPGQGVNQPATQAHTAPANPATNQQNTQANAGAKVKKPAPQQVQQAKAQVANFKAQPKPQQVPAVTFNQNHRIEGSDHWQGQQYQVFRSYQPQWHDQGWYHSHYNNVVLIGGGYYFFNNGYWFPAWGYSASAQYYPYDGPIYAGHGAEPPDKVIAQTQDLLQQMGYYKGEVDGLLGPLTRDALTAYQADQGLTQTAAIDQPTLDSLGLA